MGKLFPYDGVELSLQGRGVVQISKRQDAEDLVELSYLVHAEVAQIIQHSLRNGQVMFIVPHVTLAQ